MDTAQEMSGQEKENLAGDVMESLGEPMESNHESETTNDEEGPKGSHDPLFVQKRLKQQKRAHDREIRALHEKIAAMQSSNQPNLEEQSQTMNPYGAPQGGGIDEHIHKAVSFALQQKELAERKAKEQEHLSHIQKQYHDLNKHLDGISDKYDDFDDVVRGDDAPFTAHMRDAALLLPHTGAGSAGEVLYKLGKNRKELERIKDLHPIEQARELNKLSHALLMGEEQKSAQSPRVMGNIKSNPVNHSNAVTDKTSPSEIRARMRAGKFK